MQVLRSFGPQNHGGRAKYKQKYTLIFIQFNELPWSDPAVGRVMRERSMREVG